MVVCWWVVERCLFFWVALKLDCLGVRILVGCELSIKFMLII